MNPNFTKRLFLIVAILYCFAPMPIDLVPGPIDDAILLVLSLIAQRRLPQN